ncbi:MAG: type I-C CRISPR-associated endonuclease Cas1 [Deltaproteobacteria bacterium]|nr:type I-C CRISPR-associated endonuclease Cas1 [Deltaproteobacteria bacterium]MBW1933265.1 type I-C CRISPR-associated endonuclease Cas1 [Deltaproteobacteria bacterium]
MRRLLNTLYVTTQGAYVAKEGESIVVKVSGKVKLRVPIHAINGIVCFGNVTASPYLMGFCGERGVTISFHSEHGRFLARVDGPVSGNVLLRREQFRRADDLDASAKIAAAVVIGKIVNSRAVLQRSVRDHCKNEGADRIRKAVFQIETRIKRLKSATALDLIRGLEGDVSSIYFSVFNDMITSQKDSFRFLGRTRRPPRDNVNALLSFVYTLLLHDIRAALEAVGLDPQVGFLHRDRPGRPSLALDMMEEFRSTLADRLVLSLINLKQVRSNGLKSVETGGIYMREETRRTVLKAYQQRKQESIEHPFLHEKIPIGLLFYIQAQLLARYLRGDLDGYPPFFWK